MRRSRPLPYELHVDTHTSGGSALTLDFRNVGGAGAVFHVYDKLNLDRIPRRYTVEGGKRLTAELAEYTPVAASRYDLWIYGPNGFLREVRGTLSPRSASDPEVKLEYAPRDSAIWLILTNRSAQALSVTVRHNAYRDESQQTLRVAPKKRQVLTWSVVSSHNWYDLTVSTETLERRFAGRMENGRPSFSDPVV